VEPEGVVAKPNVPESELALFNIGTRSSGCFFTFQLAWRYSKLISQLPFGMID
jgi:hypothetical protein